MSFVTSAERLGIKKGLKEGMELGIQKGIEEGFRKGKQEGLDYGMMMGKREGIEAGLEVGMEKGILKGKLETAANMFNEGFDRETVKKLTGLTDEHLSKIEDKEKSS